MSLMILFSSPAGLTAPSVSFSSSLSSFFKWLCTSFKPSGSPGGETGEWKLVVVNHLCCAGV